jgi:PAS domain S-box-containing protein
MLILLDIERSHGASSSRYRKDDDSKGVLTERKRSEAALKDSAERYERLVNLVPDAIWVEREGRIRLANRACLELPCADSDESVIGRSPLDFIHPEFQRSALARRERLMLGLENDQRVEERIARLDGEIRDVEIAGTSFRDGKGIDPDRAGNGRTFGLIGMRERSAPAVALSPQERPAEHPTRSPASAGPCPAPNRGVRPRTGGRCPCFDLDQRS